MIYDDFRKAKPLTTISTGPYLPVCDIIGCPCSNTFFAVAHHGFCRNGQNRQFLIFRISCLMAVVVS